VNGARQWLGSVAFTLIMFLTVPIYALIVFLCAWGSYGTRFIGVRWWINTTLFLLEKLCRLDYVVEGYENLPADNCVVLMKHSSAWETIAQMKIFPRQTWVLKRELMWTPFLGWALRLLQPIAIDRRGGRSAVQQVVEQGKSRLAEGFWVVIFPEGTRVPAGQTKRYGLGGALLAIAAGCPVVPVAHNAGDYWPRRRWLKRPGTIRVVIGPPIETGARDPRDVNSEAQAFIESALERMRVPSADASRLD
jgi:1-acyl-sn-glycerol-3-phosphate acyltransferase